MDNNKYSILLVEDEFNILSFVTTILQQNNYKTIIATTCNDGILMANSYNPDIIILDLGLPDRNGIELIKEIRSKSNVPIIVLSARTTEQDKVYALDLGANDYITKPFGTNELLARIRASIRNSRMVNYITNKKMILDDLEIDFLNRRITLGGKEIKFTRIEYNIITYLAEHVGKLMTYEKIIKKIWDEDDMYHSIKKLQVNMANIRKKLDIKPGDDKYIINELGIGYRLSDGNK